MNRMRVRTTLFAAALLGAGCTGTIGNVNTGSAGSGQPTGTGTGGAGNTVATGTGGAGNMVSTGTAGTGSGVITGLGGGGVSFCDTRGIPVTSQVPRLTNDQYDRAVADLLGVTQLKASNNVQPSQILATDQAGGLTDLGWSSYQSVADLIATQVIGDATLKKNFMKCTPTGDGKACLHDTIIQFGRKAFRRPLTTDEVARFDKLVTDGSTITATGTIDEIAQTVLYAFLVSPSFITRAEANETSDGAGNYLLSSHEVAQRLSFMLWGSIPDDALNTAADNNQLTSPEQILTQATRMLTSDKARLKIADYHRYYILMGPNTRWDNVNKDTSIFPAFNPNIVPTLMAETEKFFDSVAMVKKGTFQDLILSPVAFVNMATAPLYGVSTSGLTNDFKEMNLDANQRPGFLTRVGFLNAYAFYNRTSPIHRGAFIVKQVLGTPISTPPPGAEATPLPDASADLNTNRKQVDAQTAGGVCGECHHGFINPAGFAMEAFDAVGTLQTKEKSTGVAIDTTADIVIDGTTMHITGPLDLMQKVAASKMAQHRYAQLLTSFMFEREDANDCGTINDLAAKIAPGGYTIQSLITDLTQTPQFRTRAAGVM